MRIAHCLIYLLESREIIVFLFNENWLTVKKKKKCRLNNVKKKKKSKLTGGVMIHNEKSCDEIFDGNLQFPCAWLRAWGQNNTSTPQTSILREHHDCQAYWRDRNSNEPLFAVIRRPESLWKMSYGYFWRTKRLVSPQGKPWIAGVWNYLKRGPWLMYLALVTKEVPFFVPNAIDLHQRKLYKRTWVFVKN